MWALTALLAFAIALGAHGVACRLAIKASALLKFIGLGAVIGLCLGVALYQQYGLSIGTIAGLTAYAGLCELYIFLFSSVRTSVSANLLCYLDDRDLSDAEIGELYDDRIMVQRRIERLFGSGLIEETSGRLTQTPAGARLARGLSAMRRFFHHPD